MMQDHRAGRGRDDLINTLRALVGHVLHIEAGDLSVDATFLELGADSLTLVEVLRAVAQRFGVRMTVRQLFEDVSTVTRLAEHVERLAPAAPPAAKPAPAGPEPPAAVPVRRVAPSPPWQAPAGSLERIFESQLEAFHQLVEEQLRVLAGRAPANRTVASPPPAAASKPAAVAPAPERPPAPALVALATGREGESPTRLDERRQAHLDGLVARYNARTPRSKEIAQRSRRALADSRAVVGFRPLIKEMLYPLSRGRAAGSKIWDVDGNEYVDLTMGMGVHLFGHAPPFLAPVIEEQARDGFELGMRSDLAGEVAERICALTGMERVTFTTTGTEAVMSALRLARAATGRSKVALFAGSYHGHSDGTLVRSQEVDGELRSFPVAPGVPASVGEDALVLPWGDERALEILRSRAGELAAVLVEPVQSRYPDVQPRELLHELRRLTEESGTVLLFDEMLTGFRLHPGGAQAFYGVRADLATYGKVIGGGLPIGVVAGRAELMDGIDGGMWRYGDDSYPERETTFFGGTYAQHHLSLAAARAVLRHLEAESPGLQEELNRRSEAFFRRLNGYFSDEEVPIRVVHCGSLFRFRFAADAELLFYHLLEKGVYVWEWRNCFLSTAHGDEDLERVLRAVQESVEELREGGFLPPPKKPPKKPPGGSGRSFPLTEGQQDLLALSRMSPQASAAYNESLVLRLGGPLRPEALDAALRRVIERHEALRTVFPETGQSQEVRPAAELGVTLRRADLSRAPWAAARFLRRLAERPFDPVRGPLLRPWLLLLGREEHLLAIVVHHLVLDGLSAGVLARELLALYEDRAAALPAALPFRRYVAWLAEARAARAVADEAYWRRTLDGTVAVLEPPTDRPRPPVRRFHGRQSRRVLDAAATGDLAKLGRARGASLYVTLLAAYTVLLHRWTGQDEVVVGFPVVHRPLEGDEHLVGHTVDLVPLRNRYRAGESFAGHLAAVRGRWLDAQEHASLPFTHLVRLAAVGNDPSRPPLVQTVLNYEQVPSLPTAGLRARVEAPVAEYVKFEVAVHLLLRAGELEICLETRRDLFDDTTARRLDEAFKNLLFALAAGDASPVGELPWLAASERHQLLVEANDTAAPYPSEATLAALFAAQAARTPDAVAVEDGEERLSYAELAERAGVLAGELRALGVGPDRVVALRMERGAEMVVATVAVVLAGGAYLPIDPETPEERVRFMIEDAGAVAEIADQQGSGAQRAASPSLGCQP